MTWPRKREGKKCPKCNEENVYGHDFWGVPTEKDLEEGKIIAGMISTSFKCHSCDHKWWGPDEKVYSEDIIT